MLDEARTSRTVLEAAARVVTVTQALWAGELIVLAPRSSMLPTAARGVGQVPDDWREVRRPTRHRARQSVARRRYAEAA